MYEPLRRFCQKYPEIGSCGMFSSKGPSREQCKQATFTYWFEGYGWPTNTPNLDEKPTKKVVVRCDGPDMGYIATAGYLNK